MFDLSFTAKDLVRSVWAFLAAFVVTFLISALGILEQLLRSCETHCDLPEAKSALIALAIATGTAIAVALKNLLLKDGTTAKG